MEYIHIYHTNDLHSHFDHWPRIQQFLSSRKQLHREQGEEVFLFDIGDHADRWHPYTEGTRGKGNTELLNRAGYDAVAIGNNEGITFSHEDLDSLYEHADFDVMAANLYQKDGSRPSWAKPHTIKTTKSGTRIGLIGLTAYFSHLYELLGWKLTEPLEELKRQVEALKNETDLLIILSHLGLHEDERIAREFPEVDIILGAHTHHVLHEGKMVAGRLLCGAGKYGMFVGQVTIEMNPQDKQVVQKTAHLYDTNELNQAHQEEQWTEELFIKGKELLNKTVTILPEPIQTDHFERSPLPQILVEALREWCQADCAFLNAGLLLHDLPAGPLTEYDLLKVCPHPINPCVIELSGRELKEIIIQTFDEKWPHLQIVGLGFRGTVMGRIEYDGISFEEHKGFKKIYIQSQEIKPDAFYKLAIPDMFTFGRFFPGILRAEHKKYFLPEFLRDLLGWKLAELYRQAE
ncbi:bifunctional metallophosphatase/5'-nucleotidase [Bacillus sp. V3-13]|uniref:bifunctional metallophosphatase/5'-nucleotidase n=1 Tax=Bacillus sp. V3-13 TaxID=2053728 RepID=UPI000C77FB13|nr:bifunctional UDP-sugar hydrolase/5'-nucleotidase [Bacillus sp. V3-13]PLR79333.1 bifunctional metallophosphatase/5'-nucleotidase [Bacillus sp. V3-13]